MFGFVLKPSFVVVSFIPARLPVGVRAMADDDSFWTGVVVTAVIAGSLYYCTRDDEKASSDLTKNSPSSYAIAAAGDAAKPNESTEPPPPPSNYVAEENGVYFYETVVSDDDKKKGRATGDVIGFSYIGQNSAGRHVMRIFSETGSEIGVAGCSNPCQLIRHEDGRRAAFNPNSVIGSAFLDVFRGHMKQAKTKPASESITEPEKNNPQAQQTMSVSKGFYIDDPIVEPDEATPASIDAD